MPLAVQRLIFVAFTCAVGVALLALFFYGSARFNHYDSTLTAHLLAPTGSARERLAEATSAGGNFGPLALGLLLVVGLGLIWKRPWYLLAGVAVFVLANASTQIMKLVLAHPRLQGALGVSYPIGIGYPSGHTTGALSLGFALWVTAPPRWRGWAALFGLVYATAVGLGVIIAGWHFISDVIGAILVVGFWAALVLAALVQANQETPADWLPRSELGPKPAK
ncbi:MAG: phosphatase PAP2 family protein [Thermoleophilia bacterium]|nr:phosphatase PAP2 family protein [Thermoleophilia bacterium]